MTSRMVSFLNVLVLGLIVGLHPVTLAVETRPGAVNKDKDGIYQVNLPPVAYVFRQGSPSGWVDVRLTAGGASLCLQCLDKSHPKHGETIDLTWRV